MSRPSKDQYYMDITRAVSERSNCLSAKFGAIIVRDDQIVSTGYNGAPRKTRDCIEHGSCLRRQLEVPSGERYELCRTVHAEQNAIINAARAGVSVLGGTLYLYGIKIYDNQEGQILDALPCFICKKMIINAGISAFVGSTADGNLRTFDVENWIKEWREQDMTDDIVRYDAQYKKKN